MRVYIAVIVVLCLLDLIFRAFWMTKAPAETQEHRREFLEMVIIMMADLILLAWGAALLLSSNMVHGG